MKMGSSLTGENWRVKCFWRRGTAEEGGESESSSLPRLCRGTTWPFISTCWSLNHLNHCSLWAIKDKVNESPPPALPPVNIRSGQKRAQPPQHRQFFLFHGVLNNGYRLSLANGQALRVVTLIGYTRDLTTSTFLVNREMRIQHFNVLMSRRGWPFSSDSSSVIC